jgi:Family of unknown function (DUF6804)
VGRLVARRPASIDGSSAALPAVAAAILLIVALGHHPYGYYTFLRWAVTIAALAVASASWKSKSQWVAWPFVAIAILFNPIAPVYMSRQSWRPIDIICAIAFAASIKVETTPQRDVTD